jgi:hypothetical protein
VVVPAGARPSIDHERELYACALAIETPRSPTIEADTQPRPRRGGGARVAGGDAAAAIVPVKRKTIAFFESSIWPRVVFYTNNTCFGEVVLDFPSHRNTSLEP